MLSRQVKCWILALLTLPASLVAADPTGWVGNWTGPLNLLPNSQLPHAPLLGNGAIGVALDHHSDMAIDTGVGPGRNNSLDVWLGSNSFWSCAPCLSSAPGCCRIVSIGGMVLSFLPTFSGEEPIAFYAEQRIGSAQLSTRWEAADESTVTTLTFIHPTKNVVVTNLTWTPSPARGATTPLLMNVSVWVNKPSTSGFHPRPASVGCMDAATMQPMPCENVVADNGTFLVASRQATSYPEGSPKPAWAGLAAAVHGAGATGYSVTSRVPGSLWEAAGTFVVQPGETASVFLSEAEAFDALSPDPSLAAAALLSGALQSPTPAEDVAAAAAAWWGDLWAQSSVSLPSQPLVEQLWAGAQYILACTASTDASVPAPGLYGVWNTDDDSAWNGDFTLDYNFEAAMYGVFSSNRAAQWNSYWPAVAAWMKPAQQLAATEAAVAGVQCADNAMVYACHLAPWGMQSVDQSVYMMWNGGFAALPLISAWEYTRNATFALQTTLPLLDGLNAWWACYLNRTASPDGGYVFHDNRARNPDSEHEDQPVPDPQIALAMISRTVAAQLDICAALNITAPAYLADIAAHLTPFNSGLYVWTPAAAVAEASAVNESQVLPVWTAFQNATVNASDSFALYPVWPTEFASVLSSSSTPQPGSQSSAAQASATVAQASCRAYLDLASGRPVDVFSSAVLSGYGFSYVGADGANVSVITRAPQAPTFAYSPPEVLQGMTSMLAALFGPNMLAYAAGGGIENVGVSRAINDMLLGSVGGAAADSYLQLFPFWPASEPASFTSLLAKGGFAVSAAWDAAGGRVSSPVSITAQYTLGAAPSSACRLSDPWGVGPSGGISVTCDGQPAVVSWDASGSVLSFAAPARQQCLVELTA